ncbi:LAMI_0F00342g1_1 [Lachancea mirantina]|uniref:LAMI_0F00342g1_1 n=1 Tax=Lachancea mirantina TaxID=1230905 RepID=A0A1G4JVA1_9SACH|nr:LAMI_0F00342g1_1 [Lachancea mirantina]
MGHQVVKPRNSKSNSKAKSVIKPKIAKRDRIKSKLKTEQNNLLASSVFELNLALKSNLKSGSSEVLTFSNLLKDSKEDESKKERLKNQKQETDNDMLRQLKDISDFSL